MSPMNSSQMGLVDGVSQVIYERFNGPASLTQVDSNRAFISLRKNDGPLSTLTMIDDDAQKVEVCFSFYEDIRSGANNSPLCRTSCYGNNRAVAHLWLIFSQTPVYLLHCHGLLEPIDCWSRSIPCDPQKTFKTHLFAVLYGGNLVPRIYKVILKWVGELHSEFLFFCCCPWCPGLARNYTGCSGTFAYFPEIPNRHPASCLSLSEVSSFMDFFGFFFLVNHAEGVVMESLNGCFSSGAVVSYKSYELVDFLNSLFLFWLQNGCCSAIRELHVKRIGWDASLDTSFVGYLKQFRPHFD